MTITKRNGTFPFIFDDFFIRPAYDWSLTNNSKTNSTIPAVNVKETPESYVVEVAAPGMDKKDFSVQVNDSKLTIRSEKSTEKEESDKSTYTTREFSYQSFERTFNLPKDLVDTDKIEAKYVNGILNLLIPKKEKEHAKEPKLIAIA